MVVIQQNDEGKKLVLGRLTRDSANAVEMSHTCAERVHFYNTHVAKMHGNVQYLHAQLRKFMVR